MAGTGGAGGGGDAAGPGVSGTANLGGGGGGGNANTVTGFAGGNGGAGVVIIRYSDAFLLADSTTGSPTVATTGGYNIYTFTGSGTITF